MKWIEVKERLPEKPGKYWIRYSNRKGEIKTGSLFDGFKFPHHKNRIEWLDESPQTNTLPSQIDGSLDEDYPTYEQIGGGKVWEEMSELERAYYKISKLYNANTVNRNTIKHLRAGAGSSQHQKCQDACDWPNCTLDGCIVKGSQHSEWQICPKCNGTKILHPPYEIRGSAIVTGACDVCSGIGMIVRPQSTPIPPGIVEHEEVIEFPVSHKVVSELRGKNPHDIEVDPIRYYGYDDACDTLTSLLSEKGEIKKEEGE